MPCIPRVVSEQFDVDRARSWLRICEEEHEGSCKEASELVPGMRLTDCDARVVIKAQPQMIWVALSYVWGDAQPPSLLGATSRTVEDAIKVTKDLGYRYLWIDQFCINQHDEAQKQNQIARMDAIYRGADLTIIASAGQDSNHGLPGVGTTRRKKQLLVDLESWTVLWTGPDPMKETGNSTWWRRGWTFQEGVLSRRRLFFADCQSWFECGNAWWKEGYGGPKEAHSNCSDKVHTPNGNKIRGSLFGQLVAYEKMENTPIKSNGNLRRRDCNLDGIDAFLRIVETYTQRTLKFDADTLAAFSGVANHLQGTGPRASHVFGILYIHSVLGSPTDVAYMMHNLCWRHKDHQISRRRPQFPSWTWAGWAGAVSWEELGGVSGKRSNVRWIQFEEDGETMSLEDYLRAWKPNRCLEAGLKLAICFKAQLVPSSAFSMHRAGQPYPKNGFFEKDLARNELPSSWSNCLTRVGNSMAWHDLHLQVRGPLDFLGNIERDHWSCFWLGDFSYGKRNHFFLVVEWLADGSAQRVGMMGLHERRYTFLSSKFLDGKDLIWKDVRLV